MASAPVSSVVARVCGSLCTHSGGIAQCRGIARGCALEAPVSSTFFSQYRTCRRDCTRVCAKKQIQQIWFDFRTGVAKFAHPCDNKASLKLSQNRSHGGTNSRTFTIHGRSVMSAQMLHVSLLIVGTVPRFERDAWSMVITKASNK